MTIYDGLIEMREAGMNSTSFVFVNMMSSSKQRVMGERLHLHTTCRSRAEASQGDGDDGVVLVVIRITDDQVLNGQHLRVQHTYGTDDVSSVLIQQGGRRG